MSGPVPVLHIGAPTDDGPYECARCGWPIDDWFSRWYEYRIRGKVRRLHRMCSRLPRDGFPGYGVRRVEVR